MSTVIASVESDEAVTTQERNTDLDRLKSAFERRLRKVGVTCVPDFLNEIDFYATQEDAFQAVKELVAEKVIQAVPDSRAENPAQERYELAR